MKVGLVHAAAESTPRPKGLIRASAEEGQASMDQFKACAFVFRGEYRAPLP